MGSAIVQVFGHRFSRPDLSSVIAPGCGFQNKALQEGLILRTVASAKVEPQIETPDSPARLNRLRCVLQGVVRVVWQCGSCEITCAEEIR